MKTNIVLIGMPGSGKSTVGVLLAKAVKKPFIDTDLLIQQRENRFLQEIIDNDGIDAFKQIEESVITGMNPDNSIIATGGSVIYSSRAMAHLREKSIIVYLAVKPYQLNKRLKNIKTRGIALKKGQTLEDLFNERIPLYEKYADITVDCAHKHIETIVKEIKGKIP